MRSITSSAAGTRAATAPTPRGGETPDREPTSTRTPPAIEGGRDGAPGRSTLAQHLEGVRPIVAQEAGDAPEDAQRLDGAGRLGLPHVGGFPAELLEEAGHRLLRTVVVAADEHGRPAALEVRVDHAGAAHGVERLD